MNEVLRRVSALLGVVVMNVASAAQTPAIVGAKAGDSVINGQATPGSVPITIYDISYPAATPLGSSRSMDKAGNFAVVVWPRLVAGHQLIAVDAQGRKSQAVSIGAAAKSGLSVGPAP